MAITEHAALLRQDVRYALRQLRAIQAALSDRRLRPSLTARAATNTSAAP